MKSFAKGLCVAYTISMTGSCACYLTYKGHFWFLIAVFAVTVNDIAAYLVGISMGKTPLIKISPKKTREGFLGGVLGSFVTSFILSSYFASS